MIPCWFPLGEIRRDFFSGFHAGFQQGVTNMNLEDRITIEPGKRAGKPCVRGLRITVYDVLEYLASGMSNEEILRDFPELTIEDIQACLIFAANRERRLTIVSG
jgi:uncharacterized protein (DUF433 family)